MCALLNDRQYIQPTHLGDAGVFAKLYLVILVTLDKLFFLHLAWFHILSLGDTLTMVEGCNHDGGRLA